MEDLRYFSHLSGGGLGERAWTDFFRAPGPGIIAL